MIEIERQVSNVTSLVMTKLTGTMQQNTRKNALQKNGRFNMIDELQSAACQIVKAQFSTI